MAVVKAAKARAFPGKDATIALAITLAVWTFGSFFYEADHVKSFYSLELFVIIAGLCFLNPKPTRPHSSKEVDTIACEKHDRRRVNNTRVNSKTSKLLVRNFNAAMCVAARNRDVTEVEHLMSQLQHMGGRPDASTYSSVIHVRAKVGDMEGATRWFEEMLRSHTAPVPIIFNIFISAYANVNDMDSVKVWLQRMLEHGLSPNERTWASIIVAAAKQGLAGRADVEDWLRKMKDAGIVPTGSCYHQGVVLACRDGDLEAAASWALEAELVGRTLPVHSYSMLIDSCAKSGDLDSAEKWVNHMITAGVEPNVVVFGLIFDACARRGQGARALWWRRKMAEIGVPSNERSTAILVNALAKSGMVVEAMACIRDSEAQGLPVHVIAYCSVIQVYATAGDEKAAREVFDHMVANGVKPNAFVFTALARAYARNGNSHAVEAIAEEMAAAGVLMSDYFLVAQLRAYRPYQAGRAEAVFHAATQAGIVPDKIICQSLATSVGRKRAKELVATFKLS